MTYESFTSIAIAANRLELWLSQNVGQTADYSCRLTCDNTDDTEKLATLLTELKRSLKPFRNELRQTTT